VLDAKLREMGGFDYTEDERAWAAKLSESLGSAALPLDETTRVQPYKISLGYGSTDVGDVSWATPIVSLGAATYVPGTSGHSWQSAAASGHSIGVKGASYAAKAMAVMAVELFTNAPLRKQARAEFDASRGPDYVYESLLGDRDPPLDYRK